jgi:hypothetical protein
MFSVLINGRLINATQEAGQVHGRIVMARDVPVQFTARRGSVKNALLKLPAGFPVAVAGEMITSVAAGKERPYVLHQLMITSILTAKPSLWRRVWRYLTGASHG